MGIRVMSWLGAEDGIASHFLSSGPLDRFAGWIEETEADFPGDTSPGTLDLLRDVQARGAAACRPRTPSARRAWIDCSTSTTATSATPVPVPNLFKSADNAMLPVRYYQAALPLLERSPAHRDLADLWRLLLTGRPVLRDPRELPYQSGDGVFRLSYWTHDECRHLWREQKALITWEGMSRSDGEHALEAMLRAVWMAVDAGVGLILTVS